MYACMYESVHLSACMNLFIYLSIYLDSLQGRKTEQDINGSKCRYALTI